MVTMQYLAVLCAFSFAPLGSAPAQTPKFNETAIYSFPGGVGGSLPVSSGVVRDGDGNFYGTTYTGGASGFGTVFKIDAYGNETVIHSFTGGPDGGSPSAGLVMDSWGHLFGTAAEGGVQNNEPLCYYHGCGVVFEIDETGDMRTLYRFRAGADGALPQAAVVLDREGNLYGTTQQGGTGNSGTVFKVDRNGVESVLYSFNGTDGEWPEAGLILDPEGNLYGSTIAGGRNNSGTVFKLEPGGEETVLHSFGPQNATTDGFAPEAPLLRAYNGDLYGTTFQGGGPFDGGTVFKVDRDGNEEVLHSFDGTDAYFPESPLLRDSQGNLYGTTLRGGPTGLEGTLFEISEEGAFSILFSFTAALGAEGPAGPLLMDAAGKVYGTTGLGGSTNSGTVFELTPMQ